SSPERLPCRINTQSLKSSPSKVVQQPEHKFDSDSFPSLGEVVNYKKSKKDSTCDVQSATLCYKEKEILHEVPVDPMDESQNNLNKEKNCDSYDNQENLNIPEFQKSSSTKFSISNELMDIECNTNLSQTYQQKENCVSETSCQTNGAHHSEIGIVSATESNSNDYVTTDNESIQIENNFPLNVNAPDFVPNVNSNRILVPVRKNFLDYSLVELAKGRASFIEEDIEGFAEAVFKKLHNLLDNPEEFESYFFKHHKLELDTYIELHDDIETKDLPIGEIRTPSQFSGHRDIDSTYIYSFMKLDEISSTSQENVLLLFKSSFKTFIVGVTPDKLKCFRDHFLINDPKTSYESGFSSSFGHSQGGNSKELLNSTSQDLFSLTPKINVCEGQTSNGDYQKYISQNLLFGKKGKIPRKFSFGGNENEQKSEEKSPLRSTKRQDQNEIREIKELLRNLYDGFEKFNNDTSEIKKSVKAMEFEIIKQNERIGSFEEELCKQEQVKKENYNNWKNLIKKGEDNMAELQKTLTKNIKEVKPRNDEVKNTIEMNQGKLMDNIRKHFTTQTNNNKKLTDEIKRSSEKIIKLVVFPNGSVSAIQNFQIMMFALNNSSSKDGLYEVVKRFDGSRETYKFFLVSVDNWERGRGTIGNKINNMHTRFESCINEANNYHEEKLNEKIEDLKKWIRSSHSLLRETIPSQKINTTNSEIYKTAIKLQSQNQSQSFLPLRPNYLKRPLNISCSASTASKGLISRNHNSFYENSLCNSKHKSIHTPLAKVITDRNKISTVDDNPSSESPEIIKEVKVSLYSPIGFNKPYNVQEQYSRRSTRLNIKRKITTPSLEAKQSTRRNLKNCNNFESEFFTNIDRNKKVNSRKREFETSFNNIRSGKMFSYKVETETNQSSPYLTVFEAASMADEYKFIK
ncbi:uncharacterized protein CDAR_232951, partial [Caerostris darwini]